MISLSSYSLGPCRIIVHFHPVELRGIEGYCLRNDCDYLINISDMSATVHCTKLRVGV